MSDTPAPIAEGERFDPARFFELARKIGHGRALGMEFKDSGDNWTELCLPWREELVGVPDSGLLASGAIVSLIDTASGTAIWAALGKFIPLATIDMRIDYLRPAFKGESVFARCECTKLTSRIAFTRGTAHVGDPAKPIAYSASTFMIGP
ncbi:PaaI family thioesterase [Sphingomonas sp.]|uniref:PaaI family thioesterase n=1 Tax=Sphingomonas sp. TaxID=28214 RepID=UPI00286BC1A4|nr:PaaI family thioesterase [Sphingomonas sp.]